MNSEQPAATNTQANTQATPQEPTNQNTEKSCVRKFLRSYLFYFFVASGTVVTSYLVYRRMNKN